MSVPSGVQLNESAASFAWLLRGLGLSSDLGSGLATDAWTDVRDRMRFQRDQVIQFMTDWISDPWVSKGLKNGPVNVAPSWSPPDQLDDWPTYGVGDILDAAGLRGRCTLYAPLKELLAVPHSVQASDASRAIAAFMDRERQIASHGDARMVQNEHVRAWLATAVGGLLTGVVLTPDVDPGVLVRVTTARLALPLEIKLPEMWEAANEYEEKTLELLYNLRMGADGYTEPFDPADIRIGQGEGWREHWEWLSQAIGFGEMLDALQLAARLMRCDPLLAGLVEALQSQDSRLRTIALAVLRRWLLTLKAMTWLEATLGHSWTHVRPQDLGCFAFNALKPDWPHRIIAISHRSIDAKRVLPEMKVWSSSRCAIDASYVPSWETNTGMVWGLFGATPAIVRVSSPRYGDSVWCLREAELTRYLIEQLDFLDERWILDIDLSELHSLDAIFASREGATGLPAPQASGPFHEFPPRVEVWTPPPMPSWEVRMWRASAALRAMNAFLSDADLTNRIVAEILLHGVDLPGPAPTNNPGGWREYASIFQDLQSLFADEPQEVPVRLPSSYGSADRLRDLELMRRVPDLSTGTPTLKDVLGAFEYLRTEWPITVEQRQGRFLAINCRDLSGELWATEEALSLQRGLLAMRTPVPLWIIQSAGQDVENWGIPGDHPIFTEHVSNQFSWMLEVFFDPRAAQSNFPKDSGLEFSAALLRRCAVGGDEP